MLTIPDGFKRVTMDEFFTALRSDPRDIMPYHDHPNYTTWETPGREIWGWSTPGWKTPRDEKLYALKAK